MALSIGSHFQLFHDIGQYTNGDFAHTFAAREVIPTPEVERAQAVTQYVGAGVAKQSALKRAGWTEEEIAEEEREAREEERRAQEDFAQNLLASGRRFGPVEGAADELHG